MSTESKRKPEWLKKRLPSSSSFGMTKKLLEMHKLNTVCEEARCPNRWECFSKRTATFLIMGPYCTRNCAFCSVGHKKPNPLRKEEISGILDFIKEMHLKYVVITSVTRDDLKDGGASHFVQIVKEIKKQHKGVKVEVLIPDFMGVLSSLEKVIDSGPHVLNHNIETVPRLYPSIRPKAEYTRSLGILRKSKELGCKIVKSGLMVGLGETKEEIIRTLYDIKETGCDIITIGQYLQPTKKQVEVKKYYHPDEFLELHHIAKDIGFKEAISGVFVRSSYRAYDTFINITQRK